MVRQDRWLVCVLAMALVMSACGGSASPSSTGGGSGSGGSGGTSGGTGSGTGSGTGTGSSGSGGSGSGPTVAPQPAKFVYVPSGQDPTIIPFTVDQNTGALTKQQVYQDPDGHPITAVVSTPDGKFIFASETAGSGTNFNFFLQTLTVNSSTGALSAGATIPAFSAGEAVAVDPSGTFLALGGNTTGAIRGNPAVGVYKIGSNGALTPAPGSPLAVNGEFVAGMAWDATGTFLYATVGNQTTSSAMLAEFRVNRSTGALTALATVPVAARSREVAVVGSSYVYVAGGDQGVDAFRIQNGTVTPVAGSPFSNSFFFDGIAASRDKSTLYVNDTLSEQIIWFKIQNNGSLAQGGTTGPGSFNPFGHMEIDEANKFLYSAAETTTFCFNCIAGIWGGIISSDGALTPIHGAPWETTGKSDQGRFTIVP